MLKNLPFFLVTTLALQAKEITVDLNEPIYKGSTLSTNKGGVIQADDLRIQAESLELTEINGEKILKAHTDILIVYGDKYLVGNEFTYNFATKTGELTNGLSMIDKLFVGGEKILFLNDGTMEAENSHITSDASQNPFWKVSAKEIKIDESTKAQGNRVTLDLFDQPVMWLPSLSRTINESLKKTPTFGYQFNWESGSGPLLTLSYKVWDAENFKVVTRVEGRALSTIFGEGFSLNPTAQPRSIGGSIGADWKSENKKQSLLTRQYYAYDLKQKAGKDEVYGHRYRTQGQYKGSSKDAVIESALQWDIVSDKDIASQLPSHDLEIRTSYKNEAFLKMRYDTAFLSAYLRPRLNQFQGFRQELPTLIAAFKPFEVASTGVLLENTLKASYFNYNYLPSFNGTVPDFQAGRFQTEQSVSRPFTLGPITVLPKVGVNGIIYTDSPRQIIERQFQLLSDLDAKASFEANFARFSHLVEPFVQMKYRSAPSVSTDNLFIFGLQDGLHAVSQVKFGLSNQFYGFDTGKASPTVGCDLYGYTFASSPLALAGIPKVGGELSYNLPRIALKSTLGWNIEKNQYDFANLFAGWTVSDALALSAELRSRGAYDWRKCNRDNFMFDVARPSAELLDSLFSDPRTSFLARMQLEIAPLWTLQLQGQVGVRPDNIYYAQYGINLSTVISNLWLVKFNFGQKRFNPAPAKPGPAYDYSFAISLL